MSVRGEWRSQAACRAGVDPELFFPPVEVGPLFADQVAEAKAVCGRCPVRPACLLWAVDGLAHGIAGGLTEQERSQLRTNDAERRHRTERRAASRASRLAGCSSPERAAAGRAAIRDGLGVRAAAREFGVSERTAQRWAAQVGPVAGRRVAGGR
jgi:hypothetical protein